VGAAYLVYLGFTMLLDRTSQAHQREITIPNRQSNWTIYRQGVLTNVLNPKVALFFLALLPQFVDAKSPHPAVSFILLGLTFIITGTIWCLLIVWFSSGVSHYLRRNLRAAIALQRVTGTLFIGLGLKLAMTDRQ
jgi:threonine/homoserine/homoserine lactone efflux protein